LPIDKEFYLGIVLDRAESGRRCYGFGAAAWTLRKLRLDSEKIFPETIDRPWGSRFSGSKLAFGAGPARRAGGASVNSCSRFTRYESMTRPDEINRSCYEDNR